jgi:hypothetical protein
VPGTDETACSGGSSAMEKAERPKPAEFLSRKKVFFVGSNADDTVLIAIKPHFHEKTRALFWFDTVKERGMIVKSMEVKQLGNDYVLQVIDEQNRKYVFVPLSLKFYNNMVKNRLPHGKEVATEEEMITAFEETMKLGY